MYKLHQSSLKDIKAIAKCHEECFKTSLSSKLGLPYIKKTFKWFLESDNRFLFHIINNENEVVGYCGGFVPQYIGDGSTSGIMQYSMREAFIGALLHPWLLFHSEVTPLYPIIFKNIKRKIKGAKSAAVAEPVTAFDKRVGLVVIGVRPQFRGSGLFEMLMQQFEANALQLKIYKLILSVKKTNSRAIRAYSKQGWFIIKEHDTTLEMCKYLQQ